MTGADRADVEARPLAHARAAAERYGAVVLLKGRHTLIADPTGECGSPRPALPWLATAGAGDVLAGLVGALLAAGLTPYDAASVGSGCTAPRPPWPPAAARSSPGTWPAHSPRRCRHGCSRPGWKNRRE